MTAGRDLLVYFALSALPIASYLLMNYPDTQFYLSLLLVSLVVVIWFRQYYKEPDQLVDYDENLTFESLLVVGGAVLGVLLLATVWFGAFSKSLIYVPIHQLEMAVGNLQISGFYNDVLFQLVLVATSEEMTKLVAHLSIFIWLKERIDKTYAKVVAIIIPIGFWALLHTYRNPSYMGSTMWVALSAAFIGGLIIFWVMKHTKSLLAAILTHAGYNIAIIYATYYMLTPTP